MIIYEVNLTVNNEIYHDYYQWLLDHIDVVLKIKGFQHAKIFKEKSDAANVTKLTVHYTLASEQDLNDYLATHAATLRGEAITKFGDKFSAVRRILQPAS